MMSGKIYFFMINPNLQLINTRIKIDSRNRVNQNIKQPKDEEIPTSHFIIKVGRDLNNVVSSQFMGASIPQSLNTVPTGENKMVVSSGPAGPYTIIELDVGSYNVNQLASHIQTKLAALYTGATCVYNPFIKKIVFSAAAVSYYLQFGRVESSPYLVNMLGFKTQRYTLAVSATSTANYMFHGFGGMSRIDVLCRQLFNPENYTDSNDILNQSCVGYVPFTSNAEETPTMINYVAEPHAHPVFYFPQPRTFTYITITLVARLADGDTMVVDFNGLNVELEFNLQRLAQN